MHSTGAFSFTVIVTGAIAESCLNNGNFAAMQKHEILNKTSSNALRRPSGVEYMYSYMKRYNRRQNSAVSVNVSARPPVVSRFALRCLALSWPKVIYVIVLIADDDDDEPATMQPAELSSAPVEKYRHALHALAVCCDLHHSAAHNRPLSICTYAVTVDGTERL